jgi:hypothetical protein
LIPNRFTLAALDHCAVFVQVNHGQRFQHGALGAGQGTSRFQVVGQALGFVQRSRLKGGRELSLADEPGMQCEQSEEEMVVSSHGGPPMHLRHRLDPLIIERRSVDDSTNVSALR